MGWHSSQPNTLSTWSLSEVEQYLLERLRGQLFDPEDASKQESDEEERPCWWILSALDACDGKEAREAYYSRL